jgi:hypothetical protein
VRASCPAPDVVDGGKRHLQAAAVLEAARGELEGEVAVLKLQLRAAQRGALRAAAAGLEADRGALPQAGAEAAAGLQAQEELSAADRQHQQVCLPMGSGAPDLAVAVQ